MIRISFSEADIAALEYERYHHPSPQVQKRMEVLYLKSQHLQWCSESNRLYLD